VPLAGLYAGIGGFELAFEGAGFHAGMLAEIDPAAQRVLQAHFPEAEIVGDVARIGSLPADTEIILAGFPCQNLSMAGDKSGIEGPRSGVVSGLFTLIEKHRVPIVVIENVYFMLHLDRGRAMHWLLQQLEDLDYRWAYRVLDTMGFGLPQRRRRVYLVASRTVDPRSVLFSDETQPMAPKPRTLVDPIGFYWTEGRSGVGLTVDGIPPLKGGSGLGIPSAPAVVFPDGAVLMPSLAACERLQGFPPDWTADAQPELRRAEWRMVGNAVSVPVAEWVARRIRNPGEPLELPEWNLEHGAPLPDAAYKVGSRRVTVSASDKPIRQQVGSIAAYRTSSWSALSERALAGFLKRAVEGGLRFPPGFLDALRKAKAAVATAA
jgi:DNA (cytosine-5)-methyltransferase 1